jgi:hypothetical protein
LVLTSQLSAAFEQNEATAGVQMLARLLVVILIVPGNLPTMDTSTFREKADNGFNYGR